MPRSIELNNALAASEAGEAGKATTIADGVVVEVESSVESANEGGSVDPFEKANAASTEKPATEAPAEVKEESLI